MNLLGFTKLLVIGGRTASGLTSTAEIIDLEISSSTCTNTKDFPYGFQEATAGLLSDESPLVYGGVSVSSTSKENCFNFKDKEWKYYPSLTEAKQLISMTKSPFLSENFQFILAGGYVSRGHCISTVETLTDKGWEKVLPDLPTAEFGLCILPRNSKTVMVIAPTKTYVMDSNLQWTNGPILSFAKIYFSCGRILENAKSKTFSIVVAGGYYNGAVSSVDILDHGANQWRSGPSLPFKITDSVMVEDPLGGVILIGGFDGNCKLFYCLLKKNIIISYKL